MAYSIPADPELDLTGMLDTVRDLAKKAITRGAFLGDIDDIADDYDVSSAVDDLANQKFSVMRSLFKTLGATQEDRRADYGAEDKVKATIERIAKLRVKVNSSFVLLTRHRLTALTGAFSVLSRCRSLISNLPIGVI